MIAITKKNQSRVNKAVKAITLHNMYNDLRDQADADDNMKDHKKYDRLCEKTYNDFLEHMWWLPTNQKQAILKSDLFFNSKRTLRDGGYYTSNN